MKNIIYYINKLPFDIIINNILPYTYELQNKNLLEDIKNFYINYNIIKNVYTYNQSPIIILNDLLVFCNDNNNNNYNISKKFYNIISRHYMLIHKNKNQLTNYIYRLFDDNYDEEVIVQKIKFIYGLLTNIQRDNFYYFIIFNLYNK